MHFVGNFVFLQQLFVKAAHGNNPINQDIYQTERNIDIEVSGNSESFFLQSSQLVGTLRQQILQTGVHILGGCFEGLGELVE